MAYAAASDARKYCPTLTSSIISDNDLVALIEKAENKDIKPILQSMYDLTSTEVTTSTLIKEAAAMGGAILAMQSKFNTNQTTSLKVNLDKTKEDYDELKIRLSMGNLRLRG